MPVPEAAKLRDALATAATGWEPMTLRFAGGGALDWPGDKSVWARVSGDNEQIETISKSGSRIAQDFGLFVDRRVYRPQVSIGTITEETEAHYLEDLVARLERFSGATWTAGEILLLKSDDAAPSLRVYARLPLGRPAQAQTAGA